MPEGGSAGLWLEEARIVGVGEVGGCSGARTHQELQQAVTRIGPTQRAVQQLGSPVHHRPQSRVAQKQHLKQSARTMTQLHIAPAVERQCGPQLENDRV